MSSPPSARHGRMPGTPARAQLSGRTAHVLPPTYGDYTFIGIGPGPHSIAVTTRDETRALGLIGSHDTQGLRALDVALDHYDAANEDHAGRLPGEPGYRQAA